ncbi:hypothetical protein [Pseudomonas sp. NPDC086278]|uniref:hypothetical protein n=1 Tax=Pseudomonas sp. NPDC086278 TaxID=3390646 RepID=UPI003D014305
MGVLVGTYYGAYGQDHIYLTVNSSDDNGGAVDATAIINGQTGKLTGVQKIGGATTTIMLTGGVGANSESWTFNTTDFNYLNGSRNFAGNTGVWSSQSFGLGRIS